jgi:hypothetical protein
MAGNQVFALILIVVAAYFIATYWKKILFIFTVLSITVFCFGIYGIIDTIYNELRPTSLRLTSQADLNRPIGSQLR